jgi:hypothetical protein
MCVGSESDYNSDWGAPPPPAAERSQDSAMENATLELQNLNRETQRRIQRLVDLLEKTINSESTEKAVLNTVSPELVIDVQGNERDARIKATLQRLHDMCIGELEPDYSTQSLAILAELQRDYKRNDRLAIKRPQSASTTRPGGLSAAIIEQIDRLQSQHETDLAALSAMTEITTQQEITQVTATLRSKRQERLTRLAQLKAQKAAGTAEAVTAATSPVIPQSLSNNVRAELNIFQESQDDRKKKKAILGDNSIGDVAHAFSLPAVKRGKQVPKDMETFLFLRRANSSYGAASLLARATQPGIMRLAPPASLARSERNSDTESPSDEMSASDDENLLFSDPSLTECLS